jgi:hypothetical protein
MRRCLAPLAVAALFVAAGCGEDQQALAPACTDSARAVIAALDRAPQPVTLADGTALSQCVDQARTDIELQSLGTVLTAAADRLADQRRGLALGYLVGAARRGARHNSGISIELVRRLENAGLRAGDDPALQRGLAAGEASG